MGKLSLAREDWSEDITGGLIIAPAVLKNF